MSQESVPQILIPDQFSQAHYDALMAYLTGKVLDTVVWKNLYEGIDLLDKARVVTEKNTQTFRHVYNELVGRPFANEFIASLLDADDVLQDSPKLTAEFARQITPILQQAGLLNRAVSSSILLQAYCLYWWQSFSRGYAFEVYIMRDLSVSQIEFQMHDVRQRSERFSPADLVVSGLLGDIKTSIYFLQWQGKGQLPNDFYITRLYAKSRDHTLVVFQKPFAWDVIDGDQTVPGTLETILDLLPSPVQIEVRGIILIVVDYETWKELIHHKQSGEGT